MGENMNQKFKMAIAICTSLISLTVTAQLSEPPEVLSQAIVRNSQSGVESSVRLTKNIYKTETYQAQYTVQVPYQETETYMEQVPYQVSVPYTDYETDYKQEYRCENVTKYRYEQQCRNVTDYRRDCRNEQKCYLVPGTPGQCHQVEECGTNAHGQRICKTRQVCDQPGQPAQRCENRQVCNDVPYTRQVCENISVPYVEQQCGYVNVPYQRPVTKYRTETQYRSEQRTRTVTKHRTETRCCQTATRQVFDHQASYEVVVRVPQEATLAFNEQEQIIVSLAQTEPQSVIVNLQNALHSYKVIAQNILGETIVVDLGLIITPEVVASLSDSRLVSLQTTSSSAKKAGIQLIDSTEASAQIQSLYTISLFEIKAGGIVQAINTPQTVSRDQAAQMGNSVSLAKLLGKNATLLKAGKVIRAQLAVQRQIKKSAYGQPTPITVYNDILLK